MEQVFINGEFVQAADARISVFDRGFLFGDSAYEVIPVFNQQAFFVDRHLERLRSSLDKIKINWPNYNWQDIFNQLIANSHGKEIQIYLQISRGNEGIRQHDFPKDLEPTVIAYALHGSYPTASEKEKGLHAKLIEDIRWSRCDIKSNSLLANVLLNDEATSAGFQTSILQRNGIITEGSVSNIFIVDNNKQVKTPKLNEYCLPGITRQIIIELMNKHSWQICEQDITIEELFAASEVWTTSTTREILPITNINQSIVGSGKAGNYWREIDSLYQGLKLSV